MTEPTLEQFAANINVVNKYHGHQPDGDRNIYIGRGSPLGNPFSHLPNSAARFQVASREDAIRCFEIQLERWLAEDGQHTARQALAEIGFKALSGPVNLICFCVPKACHGQAIREKLIQLYREHLDG